MTAGWRLLCIIIKHRRIYPFIALGGASKLLPLCTAVCRVTMNCRATARIINQKKILQRAHLTTKQKFTALLMTVFGYDVQPPRFQRLRISKPALSIGSLAICHAWADTVRGRHEIMFPEHYHFIAVNDGVDSTQGDTRVHPFRNIINEW